MTWRDRKHIDDEIRDETEKKYGDDEDGEDENEENQYERQNSNQNEREADEQSPTIYEELKRQCPDHSSSIVNIAP